MLILSVFSFLNGSKDFGEIVDQFLGCLILAPCLLIGGMAFAFVTSTPEFEITETISNEFA